MLPIPLFAAIDEIDRIPASFESLKFDETPVKSNDILSVVTPDIKRRLFFDAENDSTAKTQRSVTTPVKRKREMKPTPLFKKTKSSDDVKCMVNKLTEDKSLLADGSGTYALPTVSGKQQDLKSISSETMADVLEGKFKDVIDSYRIIDCRYPYEYEGGHISGAENMYLHEQILSLLQQPSAGRQILIFHCEFSSERGPKMLRFLRSKDRELNKENYPELNFPEVYLLDGGYKAFITAGYSTHCDPDSYRPMLQSEFSSDLRHFRAKSKTFTAGEKGKFARKAMRL